MKKLLLDRETLNPICGISWSGFNIEGDKKSIEEVHRLIHLAGNVKYYQDYIKELEHLLKDNQ